MSVWKPKTHLTDYKKFYGQQMIIITINGNQHNGQFVDLVRDDYPIMFTLEPKKPVVIKYAVCHLNMMKRFVIIHNNEIYKVLVDNSDELHKKYAYCRHVLMNKLPEEVVKKNIFSFLKQDFIEL